MTRLYARSNAEAHLYMDLQPCRCGASEFDRRSAVIDDAGVLCSRYAGPCAGCGAARAFVFELPEVIRPVHRDHVEYGGAEPSRLLDAGEWKLVADAHGGAAGQPHTRRELDVARAAIEEIRKFLPAGLAAQPTDRVADDAFWTERGRAARAAAPEAFGRLALAAAREVYRDLRDRAPVAASQVKPRIAYPAPDAAPAAGSLAAQLAGLATAIATHHGFEGEALRRHVADLTGQLHSVVRRSEIKAREDAVRKQTTAEVERILDGIIASGAPAGVAIAAHRAKISESLRDIDLTQLTRSLQLVVDWLRDPVETQPIDDLIANLQLSIGDLVSPPQSQAKPTAAAETNPTVVEKSEAPRALDQMFPGRRTDSA